MPRRSNWFQNLIAVIERQLAPTDAKVTESAMVWDPQACVDREIDILIETRLGIHSVTIGVECIGGESRPADVQWVERIHGKHESLPIDRSILVSRTGFSTTALKKAEAMGMETLALSDALDLDWPSRLADWPKTLQVHVRRVLRLDVLLHHAEEDGVQRLQAIGPAALAELVLYTREGVALGRLLDVAKALFDRDEVRAAAGHYPISGLAGACAIPIEVADAEGGYLLDSSGKSIAFESIRLIGVFDREVVSVPWRRARYGSAAVSYLDIPFEDNIATIVAVEQQGASPKVQIHLGKLADRELRFGLVLAPDDFPRSSPLRDA